MKTALCLSGQPRDLPEGLEQIRRNLIEPNGEVDVFVHCWFDESQVGKPFASAQPAQSGHLGTVLPDTRQRIEAIPGLKALALEPPRDFPTEGLRSAPTADQSRLQAMFYSTWQANCLKKVHEGYSGKYDVVVRTRTDMWYREPIVFADYMEEINSGHVCVCAEYQYVRVYTPTLTDVFAFGNSEVMDVFCDVYPNYAELNQSALQPFGEDLLGEQVRVKGQIPVAMLPFSAYILRTVALKDR